MGRNRTRIQPVIICGGHGSRLWPLSTERLPKPFLPLISDRSMLAETAARVEGESSAAALEFSPVIAVGAARHEAHLQRELPGAGLILEPMARNSAPAVASACLSVPAETLVLILPADHHIADPAAFHRAIEAGAARAADGALVTFGVTPDRP
ncbi:MAG: sugar phosphate nucleotidyltransferase, partial [Oceanicaulis sp.]